MIRLALFLLLLASPLLAAEPRPAKIVRVIDGDTVEATIELCGEKELGYAVAITTKARLYGINAPDGKDKKAATANLRKLIADHCKDGAFMAELKGRDKYGRCLLSILANGVDLNQRMIADGFAVIYLP